MGENYRSGINMSSKQQHWICSYDVRHPKRLKKIHDVLCMLGIAINYSLFYLRLSHSQYLQLCKDIQKIIRPEDDVRLYRCASLHTASMIGEFTSLGIQLISHQGVLL